MDIAACLLYLVPGAQFGIMDNDYKRIEWQSQAPLPSLAECEAAWSAVLATRAAQADEARKADIRAQLAANEAKRGRALSDAFLRGIDVSVDGATARERLEAIEAEQAGLRAQLK